MGLSVKRSAVISLNSRLELDKKGVAVNLEGRKLKDILNSFCKKNTNKKNENNKDSKENEEHISLEDMKKIHEKYLAEIQWQYLKDVNPPYDLNCNGPEKAKACEEYDEFKPTFLEKIFKNLGEKRKEKLLEAVKEAEKKDEKILGDYNKIHQLSCNVLCGDIDSYFQVIDEMRPFDMLLELGSEIEIGTNDSCSMEVEFKVNSENVMPKNKFNKEVYESDEEIEIAYYEFIEEYVCSSILLIAKNIMNLIPGINKVIVHAVDNVVDLDKGIKTDVTILSIVIDRETLNKLSMKNINPIDAMDYFICNIRHQKAAGFRSVERITQY